MALHLMRLDDSDRTIWAILDKSTLFRLNIDAESTADVFTYTPDELRRRQSASPMDPDTCTILSPITTPCRILCQGANYAAHAREAGLYQGKPAFNLFFTKADSSIAPPYGHITRPAHVHFLDYEIELALVVRKNCTGKQSVPKGQLQQFIGAICIANDVSARDVQFQQGQYHKAKSYRGFCPLGPVLCLLEQEDYARLEQLDLELKVNGLTRQKASTADLIFKPEETVEEWSELYDLRAGDILLTGTPSGCALKVPQGMAVRLLQALAPKWAWKRFLAIQYRRPYLQAGDQIEAHIRSSDGSLNLGTQRHSIVCL